MIRCSRLTRSKSAAVNRSVLMNCLKRSDMITMHLPLTPDTKNMLNAAAFAKMKQGVYIICAARGGVIDETALLDGIKQRKGGRCSTGCLSC